MEGIQRESEQQMKKREPTRRTRMLATIYGETTASADGEQETFSLHEVAMSKGELDQTSYTERLSLVVSIC